MLYLSKCRYWPSFLGHVIARSQCWRSGCRRFHRWRSVRWRWPERHRRSINWSWRRPIRWWSWSSRTRHRRSVGRWRCWRPKGWRRTWWGYVSRFAWSRCWRPVGRRRGCWWTIRRRWRSVRRSWWCYRRSIWWWSRTLYWRSIRRRGWWTVSYGWPIRRRCTRWTRRSIRRKRGFRRCEFWGSGRSRRCWVRWGRERYCRLRVFVSFFRWQVCVLSWSYCRCRNGQDASEYRCNLKRNIVLFSQ